MDTPTPRCIPVRINPPAVNSARSRKNSSLHPN
jgi:hypothetical protein